MSPHLSSLLTILLMIATIPDHARSSRPVSSTTLAYVNARYKAAKSLIELNPQLYVFTVFRHFRAHLADAGIGTRAHSRLPILLEDLDLMPAAYRKPLATGDRIQLRTLHHVWQLHNANQPDGDYFASVVVIPVEMRELFVVSRREIPVQSRPYRQLLDQMLQTANEHPVANTHRKRILNRAKSKKYRFLAIFWLTVMDRYIRTIEGRGIRIEIDTFQRTTLQFPGGGTERILVEHNQGRRAPNGGPNPGQVAGPLVHANRPGTSGVGTNPKRRASAPTAAAAPNSGTKRKATNQGPTQRGGKRSRGGSVDRSLDGDPNNVCQVSHPIKTYVNARYEEAKRLIKLHPQLYLFALFRNFREHLSTAGIGTWGHSHLPILLQDLHLMPTAYQKSAPSVERHELRTLWLVWQTRNANRPVEAYFAAMVLIPVEIRELFGRNELQPTGRTVSYRVLVKQMEAFVNEYPVFRENRMTSLEEDPCKTYRFLATFWLTVIDQFIRAVEVAQGHPLVENTFQRTTLLLVTPLKAVAFPMARPIVPILHGQPGYLHKTVMETNPLRKGPNGDPIPDHGAGALVHVKDLPGINPEVRVPFSPSSGTKRKATDQDGGPFQGGGKRSREGLIEET